MQNDYEELRKEVDDLAKRLDELEREFRASDQMGTVVKMYDRLLGFSSDLGRVQQAFSQQQIGVMQTVSDLGERVAANTVTLVEMREVLGEMKDWKRRIHGEGDVISAKEVGDNNQRMAVEALVSSMGADDLITFMFNNNIPESEIAGETHRVKCTNLIKWTVRRGRFWEMVQALQEARPRSLWPIDTGSLDPGVVGS